MTREEAIKEINKAFEPAFANYIIIALTEGATVSDFAKNKPKTGHWIYTGDYFTGAYETIEYIKCSCCGEYSLEEGDFCPNCGAKMEVRNKK